MLAAQQPACNAGQGGDTPMQLVQSEYRAWGPKQYVCFAVQLISTAACATGSAACCSMDVGSVELVTGEEEVGSMDHAWHAHWSCMHEGFGL